MKVIGFKTDSILIVEMGITELRMLSGITGREDFDKAFGTKTQYGVADNDERKKSFYAVENVPVGEMYNNAIETLTSYDELKTKFESIRNQLNNLLKKMVTLTPAKEE